MVESTLHTAIKEWYSHPGDQLEVKVDGYVIDIVRGDRLIEIQTRNFSALKTKLDELSASHHVWLVHPISEAKWIVRVDEGCEKVISRRKSPKRGRIEDLFNELVYIPHLFLRPNFSLEVLLIHSEEFLIDDNRGSWRRRRWSIQDRHLLKVTGNRIFSKPPDFLDLLPQTLQDSFTTKDLEEVLNIRRSLAQKMAYCLRHMGAIKIDGKSGRWLQYSRVPEHARGQGQECTHS